MPRPLTDLGLKMLGELPSRLQGSADYQAVMHAASRELARIEGYLEQVRAQFNPATADVLLSAWELEVKLPVGGAGASIPQRQAKIVGRLRKLLGASEGREWEARITEIVGSSTWSYEEHDPADPGSPPNDTLRLVLPFAAGSEPFVRAQPEIREVTPAHLALEFATTGGFILDASQLDVQTFGH